MKVAKAAHIVSVTYERPIVWKDHFIYVNRSAIERKSMENIEKLKTNPVCIRALVFDNFRVLERVGARLEF